MTVVRLAAIAARPTSVITTSAFGCVVVLPSIRGTPAWLGAESQRRPPFFGEALQPGCSASSPRRTGHKGGQGHPTPHTEQGATSDLRSPEGQGIYAPSAFG